MPKPEGMAPEPAVQEITLAGSADAAWKAAVDAVLSNGWGIKILDKASGVITTEAMQTQVAGFMANDKRYGGGPSGFGYKVNVELTSFTLQVSPEADGVHIKCLPHIEEARGEYGKTLVPSNGSLESEIFGAIKEKLQPRS